jgi:phenylalanyl-tRNA synthetase beta subunit
MDDTSSDRTKDTILTTKNILAGLLHDMGRIVYTLVETTHTHFHPKKQASIMIGDLCIGYIGQMHPSILLSL